MRQIQKFEESANKSIKKLGELLSRIFSFLIPNKIQNFSQLSLKKSKEKISNFREKAKTKIKELPGTIKEKSKAVSEASKKVTAKANAATEKLRNFDIKKVNRKTVIAGIVTLFTPAALKVKAWYVSLRPETFIAYVASGMVITFGSINIYNSSQKIAEKSNPQKAIQVEKIEEGNELSKRPGYFNATRKQFQVNHVTMPVYIESNSSVKSLVIDFKIEASNRYIREFFINNEHLIKDKLNNTIQPIIPDFPLTVEGKIIIKEKIKKEIDELIKELKIDGEIKEITFHHIITG